MELDEMEKLNFVIGLAKWKIWTSRNNGNFVYFFNELISLAAGSVLLEFDNN